MKERDREIKKESLKLIYHDEIHKCGTIMHKKFKSIDEKNSGYISLKDLRVTMQSCALLTPKEMNVIIRSFKGTETNFEYRNFEQMLFDTRYELARSRLMDTGLEKLSDHLIEEFSKHDEQQIGTISIT